MARKAFSQVWKSITGVPAANLAGKRYTFVGYNANGDIVTPAAGAKSIGVTYEPNDVGQPTQVVASGFAFITLGAALTAGTEVQVGADGKAVAFTTGRSAGVLAVGGASGDIGTVFLG